jgi:hypothetical protein
VYVETTQMYIESYGSWQTQHPVHGDVLKFQNIVTEVTVEQRPDADLRT